MDGTGEIKGICVVIVRAISGCIVAEAQLPFSTAMASVKRTIWEQWAEAPPLHAQKLLWATRVLQDCETLASFQSPLPLQLACLPLEDDADDALCLAAHQGRAADVDSILRRPVSPSMRRAGGSSTALMQAARMGHVDVVRLLCSAFADMTARDSCCRTAMDFAVEAQWSTYPALEERRSQVVKVLVESKAKVCTSHLQRGSVSDDMFSFLVSEVQRSDEVMNKEVLNTLLRWIPQCRALSDTSVKCLCEHSADPNSSSTVGAGWSPLTRAIFHGRVDIVRYLCTIGTRMDHVVDWIDEKWAALDLALVSKRECDLEIASHLIRARAEVSKFRWACNYTCGAYMTAGEVSAKPVTALSAEDLPGAFARVDKFAAAGRALCKASLSISH